MKRKTLSFTLDMERFISSHLCASERSPALPASLLLPPDPAAPLRAPEAPPPPPLLLPPLATPPPPLLLLLPPLLLKLLLLLLLPARSKAMVCDMSNVLALSWRV
jgi:hypothetical protein